MLNQKCETAHGQPNHVTTDLCMCAVQATVKESNSVDDNDDEWINLDRDAIDLLAACATPGPSLALVVKMLPRYHQIQLSFWY